MKLVFYKKDDKQVLSVYEDLENVTISGNTLTHDDGFFSQLGGTPYVLLDNEVEVPEFLTDDIVNSEENLKLMGKDIESLRSEKIGQVNTNVRNACFEGFVSPSTGFLFETEQHDQDNFTRRMLTVINDPTKTTVHWKTADGVVRVLTREQFLGVCSELDTFITSKVNTGWAIKNKLIQAQTIPDLELISLEVE